MCILQGFLYIFEVKSSFFQVRDLENFSDFLNRVPLSILGHKADNSV